MGLAKKPVLRSAAARAAAARSLSAVKSMPPSNAKLLSKHLTRKGTRPRSAPEQVDSFVRAVQRFVHVEPRLVKKLRTEFSRLLVETTSLEQTRVAHAGLVPEGDRVLTTQEAADLVGVSRPFMAARIDAGDVPLFQQVGNQRRVLASSVHAWFKTSRIRQRQAMKALTQDLYEEYGA